jgi:hypothetical protein
MRIPMIVAVMTWMTGCALAQTQRTPPSAYPTMPTFPSAFATAALNPCYSGSSRGRSGFFNDYARSDFYRGFNRRSSSFNPTSPCYTGTAFPSYSAIGPEEVPNGPIRRTLPGSDSLNEDQAKSRIEAKGYSNLSGLQKDDRGIWRGRATMKDGRSVAVILDLEGNIYSELYPFIFIRPLHSH